MAPITQNTPIQMVTDESLVNYEILFTSNLQNEVGTLLNLKYEIVSGDNFVNIKGNCHVTIDSNCTTYIKGNWDIQVDGNVNTHIKGNVTETVNGNVTEKYDSNQTTTVANNVTETFGGNQRTKISGNLDVDASRIDLN